MTRLFTAFPLPDHVAAHLAENLPPMPHGARPVRPDSWHITVVFHGEDDPDARLAALREIDMTLPAPRLRLRGSGTFPGVGWIGVQADDALPALVAAAGGSPDDYVPHLTLARWDKRRPVDLLADDYVGPEWIPRELVLFKSERGPVYTPIGQVGLLHAEQPGPTC